MSTSTVFRRTLLCVIAIMLGLMAFDLAIGLSILPWASGVAAKRTADALDMFVLICGVLLMLVVVIGLEFHDPTKHSAGERHPVRRGVVTRILQVCVETLLVIFLTSCAGIVLFPDREYMERHDALRVDAAMWMLIGGFALLRVYQVVIAAGLRASRKPTDPRNTQSGSDAAHSQQADAPRPGTPANNAPSSATNTPNEPKS